MHKIPSPFEEASPFSLGLAVISLAGNIGFIWWIVARGIADPFGAVAITWPGFVLVAVFAAVGIAARALRQTRERKRADFLREVDQIAARPD